LKLLRDGELQDLAIEPSGELFELRTQCEHFAAVCAGDDEPLITPDEAALAVAICWAAERSIQSGVPEKI
jgi:hypothetical protein